MERSPIHLSLLTLFIKEVKPRAATAHRGDAGSDPEIDTPQGLQQIEGEGLWAERQGWSHMVALEMGPR